MTGYLAIDDAIARFARHFLNIASMELVKKGTPAAVSCFKKIEILTHVLSQIGAVHAVTMM